jgi:hypothetical protein
MVAFVSSLGSTGEDALVSQLGGTTVRDFAPIHTRLINVPAASADQILAAYLSNPQVTSAQKVVTFTKDSIPNDPGYSQQWALPKISWDQAYGSITPAGHATIAVLDTGVDATHPDLSGVVNTAAGVSETGGNPNTDPNGHGTSLAGIAAATVNNGTGMAGVDYTGASVVSIQVLNSSGTGTDASVVPGIFDAEAAGAKVILMAFSSTSYSSSLASAIADAESKGIVVVAATGNSASNVATYPAGNTGVIGVAGTDQNDALLSTNDLVSADVAAPGASIYTTQPGGAYGPVSGTSPASAEVAGLAGLLIANGDTATQTFNQITGATDPIAGQSFGRINVIKALGVPVTVTPQPTPNTTPTSGPSPTYVPASNLIISGTVFQGSTSNGISGATVSCSSGCNQPSSTTSAANGTYTFTAKFASSTSLQICAVANGFAPQVLTIQGPSGHSSISGVDFHLSPGSGTTCPSTSGTPTKLAFITAPQTATAGTASSSITVQLQDSNGNAVIPSSSVAVTLSTTSTGGTFNPTSVTISNTVSSATFTYTDTVAGTPTITAAASTGCGSSGTSACTSGTQQETVTAAAAAKLVFGQQPTNTTAGNAISPAVTVQIQDQFGNLTSSTASVTLTLNTGTFSGGSNTASASAVSGVATFSNLVINNPGTYTLTASSNGCGSGGTSACTGATSNSFTVSVGTATKLVFGQQPSSTTAGTAITPAVTVKIEDASGNVVTSTASVTLTLSSGTFAGGSTTATVAATSGIATFSTLTINTAGTYTLAASSNGCGTNGTTACTGATSSSFTVSAAAAKTLTVSTPSNVIAGTAFNITVTALDQFGNTATGYSGTVKFALGTADAGATGLGNYQFTTGTGNDNGVHTFSVKLTVPTSTQTIAATDTVTATITGITNSFAVGPAATSGQGTMTVSPTSTTAGSTGNYTFTFTAPNAYFASGSQLTLAIPSGWTAPQNTTSGNPGFVSATAGSGCSSVSIASVTSSLITVNMTCNGGGTFTLAYNNATAQTTTGTATFTTQTKQSGGTLTSIATQPAVTVNPAAANKLVFGQQPSNTTAGVAISPAVTVQIQDQFGNLTTSTASVSMAIASGPGTFTGTSTTTVTAVSGVATFSNLVINTAGTYTISASSTGLASATSNSFTITAAASNKLAFLQQPTTTKSGLAITPAVTVQIQDQFGNLEATDNTDSVVLAIATNPSSGTLSGTLTQTASGGIATFSNLSINNAGTGYTLKATSGTLTSATSSAFNITARSTTITVSCSPSTVDANTGTTCTATVTDTDTAPAITPTGSVSFSVSPNTNGSFNQSGSCTLSGSGAVATCTITYTPSAADAPAVSASYGGDGPHSGSSTTTAFTVTVNLRSTTTSVSCAATTVTVNSGTTCTATVTDTDANGTKTSPTGSVSWTVSPSNGGFSAAAGSTFTSPNICTLASTGSSTAACSVTYTATTYGSPSITGTYGGDAAHSGSNGSTTLTATVGLCAGATTTSLAMCGLSLTTDFPTLTLSGQDQSAFASLSSVNIQDQQATGTAGWNVTVQASRLTCTSTDGPRCPASGDTLPAGELQMAGPLAEGPSGSQCVSGCGAPGVLSLPQGTTPFLIDTGTSVKIASYANRDASYTLKPGTVDGTAGHNLKVTAPADAYATTYHTTITLTVATGP